MRKYRNLLAFLALTAVLLGGPLLQARPASALQGGIVTYSGSHAKGGTVKFTTDGFTILSLRITNTPGGDCLWELTELDNWPAPIRIQNNSFLATNADGDELSGTFSSGLQVSGRLRIQDPRTPNCASGFITWQATGTPNSGPPLSMPPSTGTEDPGGPRLTRPAPKPIQGAADASPCQSGGQLQFAPDLIRLKQQLGDGMGDPVACAKPNFVNNDILQPTTTGLAYVRSHSGMPTFTDGWRHWALDEQGTLTTWERKSLEDEAADPPR